MAKGQKRSNRELKKPKQPKAERSGAQSSTLASGPAARERVLVGGREQTGNRNGRR
jgi:hypothetical protein